MSNVEHWEQRYREGDVPWDSGLPSSELMRVLREERIAPCPAIELGCGTGKNSVWLAEQGFDVLGVDLSRVAIQRARENPVRDGVHVRFLAADLLDFWKLGGPYRFFFDRGCYHAVRRIDARPYFENVERLTGPGALGLVLAGNAREPGQPGPPVVTEEEIRAEWGRGFEVLALREFRFDETPGIPGRPLGWSCLVRRR